jgi:hypothetical protein
MSTHIVAFIPDTDPEYQKHKKVLLACMEAEVDLPPQTAEYFRYQQPEECALEEKLEFRLVEGVHYHKWGAEMQEGFEIIVSEIPKGVHKIRVYNSW